MSVLQSLIFFLTDVTTSFPFLSILVLYNFSEVFRYYFKIFLIALWTLLGCILFIPVMLFRPRNALNIKYQIVWYKICSKFLGVEWIITGEENLPKEYTFSIFIFNHQSFMDIIAFSEMWRVTKKCTYVAKKELQYIFPFGPYLWLLGLIFIDRKKGKECGEYLDTEVKRLENEGTQLVMAPEGTRGKENKLLPFKLGAFRLALNHEAPIVPVVISPYSFINHKKRVFNSGKIFISFLPPIQTKGMEKTAEMEEKLKDLAWNQMNEKYTEMNINAEKHVKIVN